MASPYNTEAVRRVFAQLMADLEQRPYREEPCRGCGQPMAHLDAEPSRLVCARCLERPAGRG
jgi:formylmethanofuran dehydrogenase subunit E